MKRAALALLALLTLPPSAVGAEGECRETFAELWQNQSKTMRYHQLTAGEIASLVEKFGPPPGDFDEVLLITDDQIAELDFLLKGCIRFWTPEVPLERLLDVIGHPV